MAWAAAPLSTRPARRSATTGLPSWSPAWSTESQSAVPGPAHSHLQWRFAEVDHLNILLRFLQQPPQWLRDTLQQFSNYFLEIFDSNRFIM